MKDIFLKFDEKLYVFSMSGSDACGQNPDINRQGLTSDESDTTIGVVRPDKVLENQVLSSFINCSL
jgi:hypothetical protein